MSITQNSNASAANHKIRPSIPVKAHCHVEIDPLERQRIAAIAKKILVNEPAIASTGHFGRNVDCGLFPDGPALLFSDQSEITLAGPPETGLLEYRMAVLAEEDDLLVISHDRSEAFETYLRDFLDIEVCDVLIAAAEPGHERLPLPARCLKDDEVFSCIVEKACEAGRLSILPYLSTGYTWNLARRIAEEAGVRVVVAAPPPRLSRRINDKIWFSYRVADVLGSTSLAPSFTAYGPAALAGFVRRLADRTERLVIKIPDSAGSVGNLSLRAAPFRGKSLGQVKEVLLSMLLNLGWTGSFPLKVEIWETPVLSSPSAQTWIPSQKDGEPIIEGVFEQVVEGAEGQFAGAVKGKMPAEFEYKMARQAMQMALLFQHLGYFGRCSLDALVAGTSYDDAVLHWVECNGRWGGVSVPMTLINRLQPDHAEAELMIVQKKNLDMPERPFQGAVNAMRDILYRKGKSKEGIVFLTPTSYEIGIGLNFMAIAQNADRTNRLVQKTFARLSGA